MKKKKPVLGVETLPEKEKINFLPSPLFSKALFFRVVKK